jgi:translation initiation factor 4G
MQKWYLFLVLHSKIGVKFYIYFLVQVYEVCSQPAETSLKFRKQILDQCQQEFQNNSQEETKIKEIELEQIEEDKKEQLKAELEDLKFQSRRRSLGNVRFIGELYKVQMLTPKIMVECVGMLLGKSHNKIQIHFF